MDCSLAKNYIKEKSRMTKKCEINCYVCPFDLDNNGYSLPCSTFEEEHPEEAIKIIQKWSNEHPMITKLEKYIQIIKDTFGEELHIEIDDCPPVGCGNHTNCEECREWWNKPYDESEVEK